MNEQYSSVKLYEIYPPLVGLDLSIAELDPGVPVYNFLMRNGIDNVHLLLEMSENDLMNTKSRSPRQAALVELIVDKLRELSDSQS